MRTKEWKYTKKETTASAAHACFCMGPDAGETLCPCAKRQLEEQKQKWRDEDRLKESVCMWDQIKESPDYDPTKTVVLGLSCSCPKCSATC